MMESFTTANKSFYSPAHQTIHHHQPNKHIDSWFLYWFATHLGSHQTPNQPYHLNNQLFKPYTYPTTYQTNLFSSQHQPKGKTNQTMNGRLVELTPAEKIFNVSMDITHPQVPRENLRKTVKIYSEMTMTLDWLPTQLLMLNVVISLFMIFK